MKSRGVQDQSLEFILQALMDESSLLCPVHQGRTEFLKERRNNSSHSEFRQRLEERVELIEFESLTKQSLVSHLFMDESPKKLSARQAKLSGAYNRSLHKELNEMAMGARPRERKMLGEEGLISCRVAGTTEKMDDSAMTSCMGPRL